MSRRPNSLTARVDGRLISAFALDVGFLEDRAAALLVAIADRGLAAFLVKVRDDDCGAFAGESNRRRAAHPACCASDDCDFVIESSHGRIIIF